MKEIIQASARCNWKVFPQWFNHGSRHRGSISARLDALGVENDCSAVLPRI